MTKTCPDCGLSLQGRDNESVTCSDCLLEESLSNSVSKDDMSVSDKGITDEQYKEPMNNKEILLDPINMTEQLMAHIFKVSLKHSDKCSLLIASPLNSG